MVKFDKNPHLGLSFTEKLRFPENLQIPMEKLRFLRKPTNSFGTTTISGSHGTTKALRRPESGSCRLPGTSGSLGDPPEHLDSGVEVAESLESPGKSCPLSLSGPSQGPPRQLAYKPDKNPT